MLGGNNMDKILILEDEIGIRSFVSINLKKIRPKMLKSHNGNQLTYHLGK